MNMRTDRRAGDNLEIDENDPLLLLADSPWQRAFTRRFLVLEKQQQQQTDIMRLGKLGFRFIIGLAGLVSSVTGASYYFLHMR